MIGKIRIQSIENIEKEDSLGITIPDMEVDFHFDASKVATMYVYEDDEDGNFLRISIEGTEYPLKYDDYIYNSLAKLLSAKYI